MIARDLRAEVMAQSEPERLEYALALLEHYLAPVPAFFDLVTALGLRLSRREACILWALDARRGAWVTPVALLAASERGRPECDWPEPGTVSVRISDLRRKLRQADLPVRIETWPKVGYRLTAPAGFSWSGARRYG